MCLRVGGIHTRVSGMPNANLKRRGAWVGSHRWMQAKQRHGETFSHSLRLVHLFMNYLGHFSNEWWERIRWREWRVVVQCKMPTCMMCSIEKLIWEIPFWSEVVGRAQALKQIEIMRKWEELEKLQFNGKLRIIEWYRSCCSVYLYVENFKRRCFCCAFSSTLLGTTVEKFIITFFSNFSLSAELCSTMNEKLSIVSNDAIWYHWSMKRDSFAFNLLLFFSLLPSTQHWSCTSPLKREVVELK